MSYVHPNSKRCEKSEIDLFSVPPTQLSLEKGRWIDYRPLSSVQGNDSPITFMISGTDEYLDLSKTILVVKGKVVDGNGQKLSGGNAANVAPVNNFLHTLIKQVDVYLNGKQVTPAMGTYAYRSYIETLLNYDVLAKNSQLSSALYFKDTPGKMEEAGSLPQSIKVKVNVDTNGDGTFTEAEKVMWTAGSGNQGFAKRHEFIKDTSSLKTRESLFYRDLFFPMCS